MSGQVQLRGFRTSDGPNVASTASTVAGSAMKSQQNGDSIFDGRFRATRVWNGMLKRFRSAMPVKRHRRQLRIFDDCFTGREAVDFLMNELPKFIHDGREITRFSSISLQRLTTTPILVRRAASFNERYSSGQCQTKNEDFGLTAPQRNHNNDAMVPKRMAISTMLSPNAPPISRRLSASHGNLPSMLSNRKLDDVLPAERLTIRGVLKTTAAPKQDGINEITTALENVENKPGTSKRNLDPLDVVIAQLAEVNTASAETTDDMSSMQNLRYFGKVVQTHSPESDPSQGSPGAVVNEKHSGAQLLLDINAIYKSVLLDRLRAVLHVQSLKGILDYEINGADVRWNCERVGMKGIVRVPPESDYLSNYIITMMRYLSRWPFDTKFADSTRVPYEGFELNVFKNICIQFDNDCPMLPNAVALSVLNIIRLFRHRNFLMRSSADLHKETVFCAGDSPVTRYVPKKHYKSSGKDESPSSHKTNAAASKGFPGEETCRMSPPDLTHSSISTLSADSDVLPDRMAYEAILARLPGLQRSPELMKRIEELAKTNTLMPRSSTPRSQSSPLLAGVGSENEKLIKEAVSLVMLTLQPRVRRRLHYLLRFMQRVSRNYCLRLEQHRDNRSVVLEGLPGKILQPSPVISACDCHQLVVFLMENENDAFAVSEVLLAEVKRRSSLQREAILKRTETEEQPSSTERLKVHYCEPIKTEEYESQKKDVDSYLVALLDDILGNENLSSSDRKQRLKKFKKTYPEIYARKCSSPELPKTRLIDRIRSFRF